MPGASKRQKGKGRKNSSRQAGSQLTSGKEALKKEQDKYRMMPLAEKRKCYKCKEYVTREDLPTWKTYLEENEAELEKLKGDKQLIESDVDLSGRVALWRGDITALEIDCIVNAANETLLGGDGVDGAIHFAAGGNLRKECFTLDGCFPGEAKATDGYKLPAKYVVHTVGPRGEIPDVLEEAYRNSLARASEKNLKTMAFPCISTGIFGYPNEKAADVALSTVQKCLKDNASIELVIFCVFLEKDWKIYRKLMLHYFPVLDSQKKESKKSSDGLESSSSATDDLEETKEGNLAENSSGLEATDTPSATSKKVDDQNEAEQSEPFCNEDTSRQNANGALTKETVEGNIEKEEAVETPAKEVAEGKDAVDET